MINDDVELAGCRRRRVHLGQDDGDPAAGLLGPGAIVGALVLRRFDLAAQGVPRSRLCCLRRRSSSPTKPKAVVASGTLRPQNPPGTRCPIMRDRRHHALANARHSIAAGADLLAVITDLSVPGHRRPGRPINACSRGFPMISRNQQLFERAQRHIPGGVNSPVRAFRRSAARPVSSRRRRRQGAGCGRQVVPRTTSAPGVR